MRKQTPISASRDRDRGRKGRSPVLGCLGIGLAGAILAALILAGVYLKNNRMPAMTIETPPRPAVNAYNDFARAGKMAAAMKYKSPYSSPWPSPQAMVLANFAACAREAQPILQVVHAAFDKPCLAPAIRSEKDVDMTPYADLRELARTLGGVARYYEMTGQPGRAADAALDGVEMGTMIPRGGTIITALVGKACTAICLARLYPVLPSLSASELAHLADRLDRIEAKRVPYADMLLEEGRMDTSIDLEMLRDPKGLRTYAGMKSLVEETDAQGNPLPLSWPDRWQMARFALADKAAILKANRAYFQALAAEARGPYTGASHVPPPNNLLARYIGAGDQRSHFVADEAVMAVLRAQVALLRYRAAHGRYPDRLEQLVPAYLRAMPVDPFGGIPPHLLRYRRTNGGRSFLLYSVGVNMQDDGGLPEKNPMDSTGDIVARMR